MKEINYFEVKLNTRVRKHEVDKKELCEVLRNSRGGTSLKEISEKLNVPLTNVSHWFRQDKYFSIPEPDIWLQLKELLEIQTNTFDKSIMEFIEKPNSFEKGDRVYVTNACCPTILVSDNIRIIEVEEIGQDN